MRLESNNTAGDTLCPTEADGRLAGGWGVYWNGRAAANQMNAMKKIPPPYAHNVVQTEQVTAAIVICSVH